MTDVENVVLVHGGFVDGSGWEGVYRLLEQEGETPGSHAIYVSQPAVVADVIAQAARNAMAASAA